MNKIYIYKKFDKFQSDFEPGYGSELSEKPGPDPL